MKKTTQYMDGHKNVVEEEAGDLEGAFAALVVVLVIILIACSPAIVLATWTALA